MLGRSRADHRPSRGVAAGVPLHVRRRDMRVGLDARSLAAPRPRGTGRNLRDAYRLIPTLRPHWQFILYHQRPAADDFRAAGEPGAHPNVRLRQIDLCGDRWQTWFHVRLPLAAWRDGVDLMHFPASAAPRWCPVSYVATIHDLVPLKLPGELPPKETQAFQRGVARAVRRVPAWQAGGGGLAGAGAGGAQQRWVMAACRLHGAGAGAASPGAERFQRGLQEVLPEAPLQGGLRLRRTR